MIGLGLGERGLISRILSAKFGGYLTYGVLEPGTVSAPSQPTIKDLIHLYNFRQIGPYTKVFGVISKPVSHSKSPKLYNEVFKSVGFDGVYAHLLVDDIQKFFQTYSSMDFAGFRFNFLSSITLFLLFLLQVHSLYSSFLTQRRHPSQGSCTYVL